MINKRLKKKCIALFQTAFLLFGLMACGSDGKNNSGSEPEKPDSGRQTVSYMFSNELFPNPERGFYKHLSQTDALSEQTLRAYRKENISLVLRLFYLKEFRNTSISDEALKQIDADFNVIRKSGLKAIVRFAYSEAVSEPDASLEIILRHIEQLKPVLQQNKDVIAVVQAGFIGAWGEWHYSTNNLNTNGARKAVLDKLLTVLPVERCVQVRTPDYKRNYIGNKNAILSADAFSSKPIARIGHHNDCFMASIDDYGTYTDVAVDKNYLNTEGLYLPIGGETCPPDGVDPADCQKAQSEMRKLRWSYLNKDYYKGVIDNWELEGCMENIVRDMGYRFVLQSGEYSLKHASGSELSVSVKLKNVGYASMFNPRKVELILRAANGSVSYMASLTDDPRRWQPDKIVELNAKIALPERITSGDYRLFLFLPDLEPALHDLPEYAVRFANEKCWEAVTGYNDLGINIKVDAALNLPQSQSSNKFTLKK